jgi:hypothetical protein
VPCLWQCRQVIRAIDAMTTRVSARLHFRAVR